MGNYNPYTPYILGQEWVPIQDYDLVFTPGSNSIEYATGFTLSTPRQASSAKFYVKDPIALSPFAQCGEVNIYPASLADKSGPIQRVIIPCISASTTGTSTLSNAATVTDALYNPSDGGFVMLNYSVTPLYLEGFFNTSAFPQLASKRILNVSLLYAGWINDADPANTGVSVRINFTNPDSDFSVLTVVRQLDDSGREVQFGNPFTSRSNTGAMILNTSVDNPQGSGAGGVEFGVLNLGDINNFWEAGVTPISSTARARYSWTYDDLLRFEPTAPTASRQRINVSIALPATAGTAVWPTFPQIAFSYMALAVTYCEETRVAHGARDFRYNLGSNSISLKNVARSDNPILPAGDYLAAITWVSSGDRDFGNTTNGQFPPLNAVRELYTIPPHPAKQIIVPFPLDTSAVGKTFAIQETHILPQVSIHASGGDPLLEPHVYGQQAIGQVYGAFTVTQELDTSILGASASWPWVRFYARRFGDTTVPLTVTATGGSTASITPAEFDELDQITTDNWREIDLEFSPVPSFGPGTIPLLTWSSTGEVAGNRWEVLGAVAPSVTGIPGSLTTLVPTVQRLGPATYGQPVSGSIINMSWLPWTSPYVSAPADDQFSDVAVLLSQSPPSVTGFEAAPMSQILTGIGTDCDINPCCIPTELYYTQLSWDIPALTVLQDIFNRSESNTWGNPDFGPTYTPLNLASALSVADGQGLIVDLGGNAEGVNIPLPGSTNFDLQATFTNVVGGTLETGFRGRVLDANNYYAAYIDINSAASVDVVLARTVASVTTEITRISVSLNSFMTTGIGSAVNIRFMGDGTALKVKIWAPGTEEPSPWLIQVTDSNITTGNGHAVTAITGSANPITVGVSDLVLTPPRFWFGAYEIQRQDTVETEWQTIMKAANPAVSTFNDFEARPGIVSNYRIRQTNVYGFWGSWSTEVSGMVPEPGAFGGCIDGGHLLIFTTNERQDGSSNLAYSSVWLDEQVDENFVFPEAGFVQMQAMYDRDFYVAFRPLERGGEQFQRTVLVQAAAIPPETLGDFTSLRDMAWDTVNYICVRDEDGNRWFAHVSVPSGNVLRNRRLYLAPVQITEVTDTPTPVDASPWS